MARPIIALIYDFDKTLSPRDMQEYGFLPGIGIEPADFWEMCRQFSLQNQADGILAYMYMMMQTARNTMELNREALNRLGAQVEFFPGVETWFSRVNAIGAALGADVEHYIISSGVTEIIEGSRIGSEFKAIFAASFCYDAEGHPVWPATAVNYTSKTQYLFRINKGILDVTNDRDLNAYTPEYKRRIPFSNMIYIGDGLTDVPCMKLVKVGGGYSIAVYRGDTIDKVRPLLTDNRVNFIEPADYTEGSPLDATVKTILRKMLLTDRLVDASAAQTREAALCANDKK